MAASAPLALIISQLNCSHLRVLDVECNRRLEKVNAQVAELSRNMALEQDLISSIELAKRLADFVQLNEDYANILELAEGTPAVNKMIDDMATRKRRFDDAMKLVVSLIKEQTTTTTTITK